MVAAEIAVTNPNDLKPNQPGNPVLGQFSQSVRTLVTPGRKTIICKYDDPATNRQHEVELELKLVN
jgi:hypothetical protein